MRCLQLTSGTELDRRMRIRSLQMVTGGVVQSVVVQVCGWYVVYNLEYLCS